MYVHKYLNYFAVHLKLTKHCKSTMCCAKLPQSRPTLCNPLNCSPPVSSVHGILQARILEWVAIPFSRGSSQPRDRTCISKVSCVGRQALLLRAAPGKLKSTMLQFKNKRMHLPSGSPGLILHFQSSDRHFDSAT